MDQSKVNKIIVKKLNILFESLTSTEDPRIYIMFLDKYFGFINKLPEFSLKMSDYLSEKKSYFNKTKKIEEELSKEVDLEILRISALEVNPKRIKQTLKTDWEDQENDVPCDGSTLLEFYNKIKKGTGLQKYLTLKKLVGYINQNNEEIHSFACGTNFLSISEKCQRKYQEWTKKYQKLNPEGQVWWSYLQIIVEKNKVPTKIDLNKLKKYVSVLHNDIKQLLIIGDAIDNTEKKTPTVINLQIEDKSDSKQLTIKGPNSKKLNFRDKKSDICRLFLFYFQRSGEWISNKEAYEYVGNKDRVFDDMMTSLKGSIRKSQLNGYINLESEQTGCYRLTTK